LFWINPEFIIISNQGKGEAYMVGNPKSDTSSDIRKTKFTRLKEQQCSLNMQIRLAMQLHDIQAQVDLEKRLKEVTEQIDHFIW